MDKFVDCPECGGAGEQMEGRLYPNGHTEVWIDCKICEGHGSFPEDIYLILKLEGRV